MIEFLLKRLLTIVPTLVFVSILIFGLQQLLPGDPAMIIRRLTASRPFSAMPARWPPAAAKPR